MCTFPTLIVHFLAPLAIGQRAYVMVCSLPCVRPSMRVCVRLSTFSSDFDEISQKCSCHGPLQNFLKKFDSVKNCGCHGNKTEKKIENFENLLVRNHKG